MSLAVIFVMAMASAVTWLVNKYLLIQFELQYMQTIVFILVIAALVQFVEMIIQKTSPILYQALGIYLPLITTNCAVLGVALLNISENYNFSRALSMARPVPLAGRFIIILLLVFVNAGRLP